MDTTREEYLQRARKLHESSKFFLGIKAYERALDSQNIDAAFKDFILRCNAQSVSAIGNNAKVAEDCLQLCLKYLQDRGYIVGDFQNRGVVTISNQEDMSMMFLLSLTLNNWGCVLLRLGDLEAALSVFFVALEAYKVPELSCAILLNICLVQIRKCSFHEARETATSVFEELHDLSEGSEESESFFDAEEARDDFRGLLSALAYHVIAIAEEFISTNTADEQYEQARQILVANPYQQWSAVMECNQRKYRAFLQQQREEAVRRREQAEAAAAAAASLVTAPPEGLMRRRRRNSKSASGHTVGRGGKQGKKGHKPVYNSTIEDEPIELPPVDMNLEYELRINGLSSLAVSIFNLKGAAQRVFNDEDFLEEFESPFVVSENASVANNVTMILIYEETPLQVADYIQRGCTAPAKTIWSLYSPRQMDGFTLTEKTKVSVGTTPSVAASLKPFMPPPLSDRAIENAKRSVAGLEKLLTQRLTTLLRAEAVFEERWRATVMIKASLVSLNVAQGIVRLKIAMKSKRAQRAVLEDISARRIVRFFRRICSSQEDTVGLFPNRSFVLYREEKAATVLQKYARRWIAVQKLRALQAEHQAEIDRVVTVQSLYRGRRARREYRDYYKKCCAEKDAQREDTVREFAALRIQRAYRRHAWQLRRWIEMGDTKTAVLHHYHSSRVYYAILIQKVFRGFCVRRDYGKEVYTRRCYGRNMYRTAVFHVCATHIQRVYRGYRVRCRTREPLRRRMAQRVAEEAAAQRRHEEAAAVTVQCAYRSCMARRKARMYRSARERERLLRRRRVYVPFCLEEQVY